MTDDQKEIAGLVIMLIFICFVGLLGPYDIKDKPDPRHPDDGPAGKDNDEWTDY